VAAPARTSVAVWQASLGRDLEDNSESLFFIDHKIGSFAGAAAPGIIRVPNNCCSATGKFWI
jgi:hypothetical protein